MTVNLRPGDVVLSRGDGRLARAIRWGQTQRDEGQTLVNHAIIVHSGGNPYYARIVESDRVVRYGTLGDFHPKDDCWAFRPVNISETVLAHIVDAAYRRIGEQYGYAQLATQLLDNKLFGNRVIARRLFSSSKTAICSRLVLEAFATRGYDFGRPPFAASPDDVFDFCLDHPEKYQQVWQGRPIDTLS